MNWQRGGWAWRSRAVFSLGVLTLSALVAAAVPAHAQDGQRPPLGAAWVATVLYVVDGDSLWVRSEAGGARTRVRLDGIDAPEICQDDGLEARRALQTLALGQRVRVTVRAYDRYGRALASVVRLADATDLAARLVSDGLAWNQSYRWHPGRYPREAAAARRAGAGLFARPSPESPADFRRRHGVCQLPAR